MVTQNTSNELFCPTNNPKPQHIQFQYIKQGKPAYTQKKLQPDNCWLTFMLKNGLNGYKWLKKVHYATVNKQRDRALDARNSSLQELT